MSRIYGLYLWMGLFWKLAGCVLHHRMICHQFCFEYFWITFYCSFIYFFVRYLLVFRFILFTTDFLHFGFCQVWALQILSQKSTMQWKSFEHWRTMYLWICYFPQVISQRYIKYTLVHSSKCVVYLFHVRLISRRFFKEFF